VGDLVIEGRLIKLEIKEYNGWVSGLDLSASSWGSLMDYCEGFEQKIGFNKRRGNSFSIWVTNSIARTTAFRSTSNANALR